MKTLKSKLHLLDTEMKPIKMSEISDGAIFPADVFLRLNLNTYILLSRQGDKANLQELHVVEEQDVEFLYVRAADYKNFVGKNLSIADLLMDRKDVAAEKKAAFVAKALDSVFSEIELMGLNHESIEHARNVANHVRSLVQSKPDLMSMMNVLSSIPGDTLRHSMAAGAIGVMIAQKMGWTLQPTLEKLAMGALLHDVGLKEIPSEILEKKRHERSHDEQLIYETHVYRGTEILRSMPSISEDLISIVYEHHENAIGQGYPRRLRDFKMNPLAKVVSLADTFCDLVLVHPDSPNPRTPEEAIRFIEVTLGQPFNKVCFNALKEVMLGKSKPKVA